VTNGGALGSAGGVKAASKLSAVANHSSDASMSATQVHASYGISLGRRAWVSINMHKSQ